MFSKSSGGLRQRGFSLLEVLVAFAILALSLGVLFQVFSSSLRNTQISSRYSEALMVAESHLTLVASDLEEGSEDGEEGDYKWRTEVSEYDLDDDITNPGAILMRVQVTVGWKDYGKSRTVELVTLRVGSEDS